MIDVGRMCCIAISLFSVTMSVGAGEMDILQGLPKSDTPYVQVSLLQSNRENDRRTVMQADQATGVLQISGLVGRTNFEEQWAFIPSANIWIEIGHNEAVSQENSEVELDFDYLKRIVGVYDAVHIVHFHPAGFYNKGRWAEGMFDVDYGATGLVGDEIEMIALALPSPADVASSVQLVEFLNADNPALDLQFSVISPHGQVRYGATKKGAVKFVQNIGNPRMNNVQELAIGIALRRSPMSIALVIDEMSDPTIGEVIARLCAQSSSYDYSIKFER